MPRRRNGDAGGAYEVGYGKPPVRTQFQQGQPRPPRKPKPEREPTLSDYIAEELREMISFTENGRAQRMAKGRVLAKAAVNHSIKEGDLRRLKDFLPKPKPQESPDFSQADLDVIARFLAKWQGEKGGQG